MEKDQNLLTENAIKYILSKLNTGSGGRTKLMKLMFLVDQYDTKEKKIKLKGNIGNKFIIYNYGVFSFDVYDVLIKLIKRGEIKENDSKLTVNSDINEAEKILGSDLVGKINEIVVEFGSLDRKQIDMKTIELIGIPYKNKPSFLGVPVEKILMNSSNQS